MEDNIENDKFKIFSEIFENFEKKEDDPIFISTENWLAQFSRRILS